MDRASPVRQTHHRALTVRAFAVEQSVSWAFRWAMGVVLLLGALVSVLVVANEHGFYYWDFAWYAEQTLRVADTVQASPAAAAALIGRSLGDDYNLVFTIPLVPWVLLFGSNRTVYILAVYFMYFAPYAILASAVARRAVPERPRYAAAVATVAVLLTPACWYHVIQGYPDVAGAALMIAGVLLYAGWVRHGGLHRAALIGLLAGLAVLLRRHYVYAVIALYAAIVIDRLIAFAGAPDGTTKAVRARPLGGILAATAATVVVIVLPMPQFAAKALANQNLFAAYQQTPIDTAISTLATVGAVPAIIAVIGWLSSLRQRRVNRPELRLIALATTSWLIVWIGHSRQQPYHYPHWVPLFVALGIALCWIDVARLRNRFARRAAYGVVAVAVAMAWSFCIPLFALDRTAANRWRLLPDTMQRTVNPAYTEIAEAVSLLRTSAVPGDVVLVAASSAMLNADLVQSAERALFGRGRAILNVLQPPVADADATGLPDYLARATFVMIAKPLQVSLPLRYQKGISVVEKAFRERWPVADDFVELSRRFTLPVESGEIRIYKRHRAASSDVRADTVRRVELEVFGHVVSPGIWAVESVLPSLVSPAADGSARIQLHPARVSTGKPTRASLVGFSSDRASLSGRLTFLDRRCHGVELMAAAGEDASHNEWSLGVFMPSQGDRPLSASLPDLRGRRLVLEVRSLPSEPEQIDFCTIALEAVRVRGER